MTLAPAGSVLTFPSRLRTLCCTGSVLLLALVATGCGRHSTAADSGSGSNPGSPGAAGKPTDLVKLSQFGNSTYCAIATGADGTLHAVFTDSKGAGKPHFLYYRASKDGGATWSDPKDLSDDESGDSAGPCRVLVDGAGRVYAIWKYINENELLEGPNGYANGVLCFRCLEGGSWSRTQHFGDEHQPMTSYFAAVGPDGKVNLVYSRADEALDWKGRGGIYQHANNLDQLTLDGASAPKVTALMVAQHVATQDEQNAASAAGHAMAYEDTVPRSDGLWNLNGYIAADGRPHFVAEKYPASSEPQWILLYDGQKLSHFYDYKGYLGYNSFSWPPALLLEADGKEHVIRKPEKSEKAVVRDYVVENGQPGDKTDVISNTSEKATISGWFSSPLANGRVAAMAALAPNLNVMGPTDLYLAIGDGRGQWTKPLNLTDNEQREKFFARSGMSQSTSYLPKFAAATSLPDGSIGVILLNAERTISGLNVAGVTSGGSVVTGMSTSSTENPYVTFAKVTN
ncbi:MAG: hypothetical protein M3Y69_08710 [Verrucomicrobiota bacterium]|nr:hypothetical protein [Verrucomicrobiota bacterium]